MRNPLSDRIEMARTAPTDTGSRHLGWVATAPCNHGVYDAASAPTNPSVVVDDAVASGASGIDLGPVDWWGQPGAFTSQLDAADLSIAGGWFQLGSPDTPTPDPAPILAALVRGWRRGPPPALTVAAPATQDARVGVAASLDDDNWSHLLRQLAAVEEAAADADIPVSFHPHIGTWIESTDQVHELLERTSTGLCLDTGHLALGGVDLPALVAGHQDRINQVHLKDVDLGAFHELARSDHAVGAVWAHRVFVPLGQGDLELATIVAALGRITGWWVIEQDAPFDGVDLHQVAADLVHNVNITTEWLFA